MKSISISILIVLVLIFGAIMISNNKSNSNPNSDVEINVVVNNISVVDGKQIVEIRAKGGYQPRKSIAKAGIPTILRFNTNSTFDCSSFIRIPSLDISKALPQTGTTDVDIGVSQVGKLNGACGMGMYPFEVDFQN